MKYICKTKALRYQKKYVYERDMYKKLGFKMITMPYLKFISLIISIVYLKHVITIRLID